MSSDVNFDSVIKHCCLDHADEHCDIVA